MKIAQVTSTFPPYEGGIGNVCYNISKLLALRGHDITVFIPENSRKQIKRADGPFKLRVLRALFSFGNASFLPILTISLKDFDIIHLHYPFFGGDIFVYLASRLYKIPYVVTYHQDVKGASAFKRLVFRIYNFLFRRVVISNASRIQVLSKDHFIHSEISNIFNQSDKVAYIPNGVDVDYIDSVEEFPMLRKKFHISDNSFLLIFIGGLDDAHYFKGVHLLIHALQSLRLKAHLLIVGGGDLEDVHKDLAKKLGVSENVIFFGKKSNSDAIAILKSADALVLPSTDTESFGIVLLEAMVCCKPVIASLLPGVRVLIEDGVNGLLFPKGDVSELVVKLTTLIDDPQLGVTMGRNGRATVVKEYQWSTIVTALESMYRESVT